MSTEPVNSLRERRQRAGISRQQLAALAQCSVSVLQLMETGYSPRRSAVRDRVVRVLDGLLGDEEAGT